MTPKEKLNLILLGPAHPFRGGIADTNHAFATELVNQNISFELWTFTNLYPSIVFPGKTQYQTSKKEFSFPIHRKIHAYNPFNWKKIAYKINDQNPEVVVFRYWSPFLAPVLGSIARNLKPNIKKVALVDNWKPHEPKPWDKMLNRYFSDSMDMITTFSEAVHSEIAKDVKLPTNKGFHPITTDLPKLITKEEARKKLKLEPKTPLLLFFGLIRSYKGLDLLIDAMATNPLLDSKTELLIVGEFYDNIDKYQGQIKRLGLESRIRIVDKFVPFEVARDYFCATDVIVQPYKTATQSGITPLAYYYETPVVVTDLAGLKTPIQSDQTGEISNQNPLDLSSKITSLLAPEQLSIATENIIKNKNKYSWKLFVEQWLAFIQ